MQASMDVEMSVALNFVISYLYNKLPRRRVNFFGEELEKGLRRKFSGHWYPNQPNKGSAYRCIRATGDDIDEVMIWAAEQSRLDLEEVKQNLPRDLTVWIDPHEVSYRIGEKGQPKLLYSAKHKQPEIQEEHEVMTTRGFNPEAQCFKPIDSLSSSLSSLSMSPSSPTPTEGLTPTGLYMPASKTNYLQRHMKGPAFTTASFAATKFGSTKLKTQAKRPTRLSPTEIGFVKQRGGGLYSPQGTTLPSPQNGGFLMPPRPQSVSPRDIQQTQDPLEAQQLLLMQQALIQQHNQIQQQQQMLRLPSSPQHRLIGSSQSPLASPVKADRSELSIGLQGLSSNNSPMSLGLTDLSSPSTSALPGPFSGPFPGPSMSYGASSSLPASTLSSPDPSKALLDMANSLPYSIQHLIASN